MSTTASSKYTLTGSDEKKCIELCNKDRRCSITNAGFSSSNANVLQHDHSSQLLSQSFLFAPLPFPMALTPPLEVDVATLISKPLTAVSKRPSISPLQPTSSHPYHLVDERRDINRSLKICGFPSARSAPCFPLSPLSPSSPSSSKSSLKLPELEVLPLSPPATPVSLLESKPLPSPVTLSDSHFDVPPLSTSELPPRRQPLRSANDKFTPAWIRGIGQDKEGYCSLCEDETERSGGGKWLRLKDGDFWYHRTFVHGISSISGQPFSNPIETRCVSVDERGLSTLQGLCGTCSSWTTFETYRSKLSSSSGPALTASRTMWYRHAHECHPQTSIPRPPTIKSKSVEPAFPFISLPIVSA
ncbi:hypothetical protein JCM3765_002773 [Sporobolomyces pararoseus]